MGRPIPDFHKIILPLSFPALPPFAIFQFLWTWNDLLVAKVFLIDATGETTVMTAQIVELLGTRGGNWEILATAAFVSSRCRWQCFSRCSATSCAAC